MSRLRLNEYAAEMLPPGIGVTTKGGVELSVGSRVQCICHTDLCLVTLVIVTPSNEVLAQAAHFIGYRDGFEDYRNMIMAMLKDKAFGEDPS